MKHITVIFFLVTAVLSVVAQNFEGVIEMDAYIKETADRTSAKWLIKNGNSRMELKGDAGGVSYDYTLLMPKNSTMYLLSEIDGRKAAFPADKPEVAELIPADAVVKVAGNKKNIAGLNAFLVKIESGDGSAEVWVTDDSKLSADDFPAMVKTRGAVRALKANNISGIPLEIVNKNNSGEITYSYKINSITPKSLSDDLFTVPLGAKTGEELMKESIKVE